MKSFFKKLAFVMAMAMVVSLAAPAAASAAEKEVVIVPQTGAAEKVEYIVFTEGGEAQDFRFLNAPANWREIYDWKVVDTTVATVDKGGIVTPVAKGQTKLQFLLDGEVAAEATILVNPVSTTNEFELTQASATQLKLTFTDEVKLGADEFVLKMLIECNGVKEEVKWPAAFTVDKDDKHVVWCTPSVKLGNGDEYIVYAGEGTAEYTDTVVTKLDKVDTLKITTLKTEVVKDADAVKVVTSKFFAGNVDLTALYVGDYEVKYEVKPVDDKYDEDDFDFTVNKSDWSLSVEIYEVGCALTITATLYDDDEKQLGQPVNTGVTCVAEKEWDFELNVVDWALVQEDAKCVNWDLEAIPADKSGQEGQKPYHIVLKFKDNDGKFWVTRPEALQDDKGETNGNYGDAENKLIDGKTDPISLAGYSFSFYSTDSDLMLVDETTGAIGVYTPADVSFYVKAEYDAEKASDSFEKYIFAQTIEIKEATKLDTIAANKDSVEIVMDALDDDFEATAKVTMSAKDQHKGAWTLTKYSAYYTNKDGKKEVITTGINGNEITFSAAQFAGKVNTSSVKVTIVGESTAPFATEKDETTVTVKLVEPKYTDSNKTQIKVDVEERNHYKTYDSVKVDDDKIDVKAVKATGYITLYKTSGDLKVGYHTAADENAFVAITSKAQLDSMTNEGDRYVVMKDVDGNIIPLTWTGNKLMYTLNTTDATKLDAQSNELLVYAKEGNYTVEAVTVRYHDKNTTRRGDIIEPASIKVENGAKTITVKKIKSTEFGADCKDAQGKIDLGDVALEVIEFELNGYAAVTRPMIADVEAVVIGDSVILQYVVLNVPVGNGAFVQMKVAPSKPVSLKYNANKVY